MNRFFFAICPDNSTKDEIVKCREQINLSGQMIKKSNLHLTLLFLGRINVNQQQEIIRQAEQISATDFNMVLNHSGCFNHKITWLGLKFIPDPLLTLHKQLLAAAKNCAIPLATQSYLPHVTLARKSTPIQNQLISPIKWHVKEFVLLESIDIASGVHYRPVQYFSCT
jgi:2'-5' RNA ligase